MCGIVGYVGHRSATDVILDGLQRLEYRGYDSAGLAVLNGHGLEIRRHPGKIRGLETLVRTHPLSGGVGLGHTRWATHGPPSEENAHPHADCSGSLVVVHNGIIENYLSLKERLLAEGHRFRSDTDTEVVAHLIERQLKMGADLLEATKMALRQIRGAYAVAILSAAEPDRLIAAKHGAGAVVVGLGEAEAYLASDIAAILPYTRDVVVLEDDEVAVLTREGAALTTLDGRVIERAPSRVAWDATMAQKDGYPHFMLKEIYEQPRAVTDTFQGRIDEELGSVVLADANLERREIRQLRRVVLVACGTSYNAGLVGRFMIERMAGLPAEVDVASEFRYRDLVLGPDTLVIAISQSGETADTLGAVKAARAGRAPVLGITNVVGSALAREATGIFSTLGARDRRGLQQDVLGHGDGVLHDRARHRPDARLSVEHRRLEADRRVARGAGDHGAYPGRRGRHDAPAGRRAGGLSRVPLSRARRPPPDRARGRPQAQGAVVHPR